MKVLLINPNRYQSPPVPPLGLEYIAGSLEEKGHHAEVLDLCFSENILALSSAYELNAFLAANYRSLVIEKAVWENLVGEAK